MHNVLLHCYTDYGRFITRKRGIPYYKDMLTLVARRLLIVGHQLSKKSSSLIKSAKIVGITIAELHPHGDQSVYNTLVKLVKQGYFEDPGGFGSPGLIPTPAGAYRYTQTRLKDWVLDAFKLIDFVPKIVIEDVEEPEFIPYPVPIGLIGSDFIHGIGFAKSVIPKYKATDLFKRLSYLLNKDDKYIPKPNVNCEIVDTSDSEFESIFTRGEAIITIQPIIEKLKGKKCLIRSPYNFSKLIEYCDANKIEIHDYSSGGKVEIQVNEYADRIRDLLRTKIHIKVTVSDNLDHTEPMSCNVTPLDQILLTSYQQWLNTYKRKIDYDINKIQSKIDELNDLAKLKNSYEKAVNAGHKVLTIDDLIKVCKDLPSDRVRYLANKHTISKLFSIKIDTQYLTNQLNSLKSITDEVLYEEANTTINANHT